MVCAACSGQGNGDARFCSHCGRPVTAPAWNAFAGRLVRPRNGRMLAGVCLGISEAYGFDPVIVRILAVALFFCGFGSVGLIYIAAWIIMPNAALTFIPTATPSGFAGSAPIS